MPIFLVAAYGLLIMYGSLHPFSGWHSSGAHAWAFLLTPWPRYWTTFDLAINVMAYVPLGFFAVPAFRLSLGPVAGVLSSIVVGVLLSTLMEGAQTFVYSRVASNLDLLANGAGVIVGTVAGAKWGRTLMEGGALHTIVFRLVGNGWISMTGLLLMALWLLAQLNPQIRIFGSGDLRAVLEQTDLPDVTPYTVEQFLWIEASIAASNTLSIALLCGCLFRERKWELTLLTISLALAMKGASLLMLPNAAGLAWVTPSSLLGLALGITLWVPCSSLSFGVRRSLAAITLMLATVLVNLVPRNPYVTAMLQIDQNGPFLNFNGMTGLVSTLWPIFALSWLLLTRTSAGRLAMKG